MFTPSIPHSTSGASIPKRRNSNLELYRIIVMILIIMHHYVVNSGLLEVIKDSEFSYASAAMLLFGAWGKTGINCFVLITGYFMCTSHITGHKLLKLYLQILIYALIIFIIFYLTGQEHLSSGKITRIVVPIQSIYDDFISCFLVFFLLIPFLNILIQNMSRKMHLYLLALLLTVYSIFPTMRIAVSYNYVSWFSVIYIVASYIRKYNWGKTISHTTWGFLTILSIILGAISVLVLFRLHNEGYIKMTDYYFYISDSNKILSFTIALTSFMWFKDIKMNYSKLINTMGATTFGVLLIHANSDTMRHWLWYQTVDAVGHFESSLYGGFFYALGTVLIIFIICSGIDWFRGRVIEPLYMRVISHQMTNIKQKFLLWKF